jgi:hypothetical protein
MKHFLIKYRFQNGSPEDWHREIKRFIAALDSDPLCAGKIAYRCMKAGDGSGYYHLASVADEETSKAVQSRDFFAAYKEKTHHYAGGAVEVLPLEIIAETATVA